MLLELPEVRRTHVGSKVLVVACGDVGAILRSRGDFVVILGDLRRSCDLVAILRCRGDLRDLARSGAICGRLWRRSKLRHGRIAPRGGRGGEE